MSYERVDAAALDTRTSAVDLTGKENLFCSVNASNELILATASTIVTGIIKEGKLIGYGSTYAFGGQHKLKLAGTVAAGASVKSNAAGLGIAAVATDKAFARADMAGVTGDVITVTIDQHVV